MNRPWSAEPLPGSDQPRPRLLVLLHHLELGGSQLNALDLARAMGSLGYEVHVAAFQRAGPMPMIRLVAEAGLPFHLLPPLCSLSVREVTLAAQSITRLVRREGIRLIHAYEAPAGLISHLGGTGACGIPVVMTILGYSVPRWLPRRPPLLLGTREMVEETAPWWEGPVLLMEPPVDTERDDMAVVDTRTFRAEYGLTEERPTAVIVTRLEPEMKLESVLRSISAMTHVDDLGTRLVVVGEGPSFDLVAQAAGAVNDRVGRAAVVLTGGVADPRPAYAMGDVVIGMGGSALRGLAFSKPLIVTGVNGYSQVYSPETEAEFYGRGFFGNGRCGPDLLPRQLRGLLSNRAERERLGAFGRETVRQGYDLRRAADLLDDLYRRVPRRISPRARLREVALSQAHFAASTHLCDAAKPRARTVVSRVTGRADVPASPPKY